MADATLKEEALMHAPAPTSLAEVLPLGVHLVWRASDGAEFVCSRRWLRRLFRQGDAAEMAAHITGMLDAARREPKGPVDYHAIGEALGEACPKCLGPTTDPDIKWLPGDIWEGRRTPDLLRVGCPRCGYSVDIPCADAGVV